MPNIAKFGNEPISRTKYQSMTQDEQLQSIKEMGMVFTYLNTQEIWDNFCSTYEAMTSENSTHGTRKMGGELQPLLSEMSGRNIFTFI